MQTSFVNSFLLTQMCCGGLCLHTRTIVSIDFDAVQPRVFMFEILFESRLLLWITFRTFKYRSASWDFAFLKILTRLLRVHGSQRYIRANPPMRKPFFDFWQGSRRVHRVHRNDIWTQKITIFRVFCEKKCTSDTIATSYFQIGSLHEKGTFAGWHAPHIFHFLQTFFTISKLSSEPRRIWSISVILAWFFTLCECLCPLCLHYGRFWYPRFYTRKIYQKTYIWATGPSYKIRDPRRVVLEHSRIPRRRFHGLYNDIIVMDLSCAAVGLPQVLRETLHDPSWPWRNPLWTLLPTFSEARSGYRVEVPKRFTEGSRWTFPWSWEFGYTFFEIGVYE